LEAIGFHRNAHPGGETKNIATDQGSGQSLLKGMILGACACLDVIGLGDEATAGAQN